MWRFAVLFTIVLAVPVSAQSWQTPARGTQARDDLLSAIRPHAEWKLGAPVQFVVNDLRIWRDIAFAVLAPQRPGGRVIDPAETPMATRDGDYIDDMDGVSMQVLYVKSGHMWVALHWEIGATEAWYADPILCARFSPVIPEVCR
ncbi:hypothetical protein [Actibacterium lipolyticum]|uniref:Uncharacterized protein n=1 Tax=Actibacterium lipolyticum TaxID=1524263 RepID=A0A238KMT1_9RHOB|nr:hypothetical protein [Actibacterium lipolyticum]SMX43960.1 hypothetical protein COL8621_02422 [Actibacterium lipolyticum]